MLRKGLGCGVVLAWAGSLGCSGGGSGAASADGSASDDGSVLLEGGSDAAGADAGERDADFGADGGSEGSTGSLCPIAFPADPNLCSGVEVFGSPIVAACSHSIPPAGQGGAVQNGRYVLDSITLYPTGSSSDCPPAASQTGQVTWVVCGGVWATVDRFPGFDGGPDTRQFDVTAATDGGQLTVTVACPSSLAGHFYQYQYTAAPGHLALIYPSQYSASGIFYSFTEVDAFVLR